MCQLPTGSIPVPRDFMEDVMNCKECYLRDRKTHCESCKRMQAEGGWLWEIDNGNRIIRCPYCGHGFPISAFAYENWHRYCAYCGKQLIHGEQIKMEV